MVLAQDRDRFVREPAYHLLLRKEFEEHDCTLRALNDRGDDSPEVELANGILDQIAKFERAKMADRTRRGRMRKAREGKNLRSPQPPIGFRYEETGDGLVIHEPEMLIVKKVFEMAAAGLGLRAIQNRLYSAGMTTRKGNPVWQHKVLRYMLSSDIYKPHTYAEIAELLTPEVARRPDQDEEYGIRWHNRYKITQHPVSEPDGNGGRRYRRRTTTSLRPKEVEPLIWEFVSELLKEPEHIRRGLEKMITLQREGTNEDPDRSRQQTLPLPGYGR